MIIVFLFPKHLQILHDSAIRKKTHSMSLYSIHFDWWFLQVEEPFAVCNCIVLCFASIFYVSETESRIQQLIKHESIFLRWLLSSSSWNISKHFVTVLKERIATPWVSYSICFHWWSVQVKKSTVGNGVAFIVLVGDSEILIQLFIRHEYTFLRRLLYFSSWNISEHFLTVLWKEETVYESPIAFASIDDFFSWKKNI